MIYIYILKTFKKILKKLVIRKWEQVVYTQVKIETDGETLSKYDEKYEVVE